MDQPQQQKSWFARNWFWVVPIGCLLPLCVCGGGIAGIFLVAFEALESSEAYQHSVAAAQASPEVKELLGEPVKPGLPMGSVNIKNDTGDADLTITLTGPKGTAKLHVVGKKEGGHWNFSQMDVTDEKTGAKIDLLKK